MTFKERSDLQLQYKPSISRKLCSYSNSTPSSERYSVEGLQFHNLEPHSQFFAIYSAIIPGAQQG